MRKALSYIAILLLWCGISWAGPEINQQNAYDPANVAITGGSIAAPEILCTATGDIAAGQVLRTILNSYGRGEAVTSTLPTAAAGATFTVIVGTQHNSAWKIQRGGTDTITWNGTAGKTYFQETNQAVGSRVSCMTFKTGAATWTWACDSAWGTWVTD